MEGALAIVGGIGVVIQLSQIVIRLAHDWKDASQSAKSFIAELEALRSILEHTTTKLMLNSEFVKAFEGRESVLLRHLGDHKGPQSTIRQSLDICRLELEKLVAVVQERASGHKFGLHRIKSAFMAGDLRDAVSQLSRQCKAMNSLVSLDTAALAAATLSELSLVRKDLHDHSAAQLQASVGIQQAVSDVHQHLAAQVADREVQDALSWLSPPDYSTRHSDLASRGQEGTGKWLLKSERFQDWLSGRERILYCPGMPGAGKTTLLSMAVDYITANYGHHPGTGVAFLYLDFQRSHEQNAVECLARLLRQLAQTSGHHSAVTALRDRHRASHSRPSVAHLAAALSDVVSTASRCFIFIDALDECLKPDRRLLLDTLLSLQRESAVQLFCTSRFDQQISSSFSGSTWLEIRASDEDVSLFLQDHMKELPVFTHRNSDLQTEVERTILRSVQGMFLLARLHLNSLLGARSKKALRKTLYSLPHGPEGYDQAYDDAMHRIEQQGCNARNFAHQILSWIVGTRRPLSLLELRHALAIEMGEADMDEDNLSDPGDILSACAGLVVVDEQSSIIRLVHHTTQEYFQRAWRRWFPEIHHVIHNACLTYLSFTKFRELCASRTEVTKRLLSYPLYGYACQHWAYHALQASTDSLISTARTLKEKGTWASALQAKTLASKRTLGLSKRILGLSFEDFPFKSDGSGEMIDQLNPKLLYLSSSKKNPAKSTRHPNEKLRHNSSGLETGNIISDSSETTQMCLPERKPRQASEDDLNFWRTVICDLITADGSPDYDPPFHTSSEVVNGRDSAGRTPLHEACELGRADVVKNLLAVAGIDPNLTNIAGETPLIAAIKKGHENIVKSLLGLDNTMIHKTDKFHWSAFCWAAMKGRLEIMELLLAHKPFGSPWYNPLSQTPLLIAAQYGQTDIVERLLREKGIDVDHPNEHGCTALWLAACGGHRDIVALLMEIHGVDVNHRDHRGRTALMIACRPGFEQIVSALVEEGCCNVEVADTKGRHALFHAVFWNSPTVMATLLRAAPSIANAYDLIGYTPLHYAAKQNSEPMIQLLLHYGARIDAKDISGITPLMWAASHFQLSAAGCLLKAGADMTLTDHNGANVLHHCAMRNGTHGLEFFLNAAHQAGSPQSTGVRDHWGNNLLHSLLLGVGCSVGTLENCRQVSLRRIIAVQHLLRLGISVQERNYRGLSPLSQYLDIGSPLIPNKEVCELLFRAGSDAGWRSPTGQTLAHLYAQGRDDYMALEVLRTLKAHGVDLSAVDVDGQTILHYLVQYQGLTAKIMRYLLLYTELDTSGEDLRDRTAAQLLGPEPADTSDLSTTEKEAERLREILKMPRPQSGPDPDETILKNLSL